MKKTLTLLMTSLLLAVSGVLFAQFDDLYADADDVSYAYSTDSYDDYDVRDYGYALDADDYDDYTEYTRSGYDIDAYTYTNRLDRYRLAYFATRYYGPTLTYTYGNTFYNDLARRAAYDRQFRTYLERSLIFGPSYSSIYRSYGNYGDPYSLTWNGFGRSNRYYGTRGLSGYYGGYGQTSYNPYCPPSSNYRASQRAISNSDIRSRINAPRDNGSTVRSRSVRTTDIRPKTNRAVRTTATRNRVTRNDRVRGSNRVRSTRTTVTRSTPSRNTRIRTNTRSNTRTRINSGTRSRSTSRATSTNRRSSTTRSTSRRSVRGNN